MPTKDTTEIEFTVCDTDAETLQSVQNLSGQVADIVPAERLEFVTRAEGNSTQALLIAIRTPAKDEHTIEIAKPFRVGRVLDVILSNYKMHAGGGDAEISIGGWLLDTAYNTLLSPDGEVVKLTEKETAILRYLNGQQDDVTKDELLQAVWEYAEDVETHTLETHIYRLRQKIEDDPANPQIVVTTEKGYRLKV